MGCLGCLGQTPDGLKEEEGHSPGGSQGARSIFPGEEKALAETRRVSSVNSSRCGSSGVEDSANRSLGMILLPKVH